MSNRSASKQTQLPGPEFMARRGKGKHSAPSVSQSEFTRIHQSATIYAPFPTKKGEKPIDYDTRPAKTILAIIGAAVLALLIWLDHKGY